MLYGRKFTLQTDHKPLLSIFCSKKGIPVYTANRLQRWALILKAYDFDIKYINTTEFGHADILSRLINTNTPTIEDTVIATIKLEADIKSVLTTAIDNLPVKFNQIVKATSTSTILQQVISFIQTGWPHNINDNSELCKFFARRDALSTAQGCLMFAGRVVIPDVYHNQIIKQLHQGHTGQTRMKELARSYVYWPNIDKQIEDFVRNCAQCASTAKSPVKIPLAPWPTTAGPWQRIHIDYAGPVNDWYYLVVVDSNSKWPEVVSTKTITTSFTIDALDDIFARFGNPEVIVSDNGTQFTSDAFQQFCHSRGIRHVRTAPYHPQSNGLAERFVDTLKRALKKFDAGGTPLTRHMQLFLSSYRTTPNRNAPNGLSPAEIVFGRRIRTNFDLLLPPPTPTIPLQSDSKSKKQYDRQHGVKPKHLQVGDTVFAKIYGINKWSWAPGRIIERIGSTMYNVLLDEPTRRNHLIRSHADQIRPRTQNDCQATNTQSSTTQRPFDILMETFEITPHRITPSSAPAPTPTPTHTVTQAAAPPAVLPANQRPVRQRKAPDYYGNVVHH